jgi:hypothetical protein
VDDKDDDVGRKVKGPRLLHEGIQAMPLYVRTPDLPASCEGTLPARISHMRDAVTPTGSARHGSQPTVRKAQLPSGNRKNQEAKAASRKAKGKHNLTDRAINEDGKTQIERSQTWFWYITQRTM